MSKKLSEKKTFPRFWGEVVIQPAGTLKETAVALGKALGGIEFQEDTEGTYEEYPAFEANVLGFELVLYGIPDEEEDCGDPANRIFAFFLQINIVRGVSLHSIDENTMDLSHFFAVVISENSDLVCGTFEEMKPLVGPVPKGYRCRS